MSHYPAMKRASLALLVMAMPVTPRVIAAQSYRDSVMVLAGALQFVRENSAGHGTIAIDTMAQFAGTPAAQSRTLRDAVVAAALSTRMGTRADFVDCEHPQERGACRLHGVDAVAGLVAPHFHADSAFVRVSLMEGAQAGHQMSGRVYVVRFLKRGASWDYASATLRSQT